MIHKLTVESSKIGVVGVSKNDWKTKKILYLCRKSAKVNEFLITLLYALGGHIEGFFNAKYYEGNIETILFSWGW